MALLITGAAGHIGATLTKLALEEGIQVIAQYRSGIPDHISREVRERAKWVGCELSDTFSLAALTAQHKIDACVHTAAMPNDRLAKPRPWETVQSNINVTAALLELARRQGWKRLLYVSSGSVFQGATALDKPILENNAPDARSVYGTTKLAAEMLVGMYRREYGVSASTVRVSFVYGPPMLPDRDDLPRGPIPRWLLEAIQGRPVCETSGGDFVGSYTHVKDVAAGLLAAYRADKLNHPVYHLGHGRNWSGYEVAEAIKKVVPGSIVEIGPGTEPWTQLIAMRSPLAGDLLKHDTGFVPRLSLQDGIKDFADWIRSRAT
jgi:nucleoside-diphosphate-sugar epimerase